jgi:hypothetical protein
MFYFFYIVNLIYKSKNHINGDWGLGIGDWGFGVWGGGA